MTEVSPEASRQAVVEAALVLLERMGLSPADLAAVPQSRKPVPTFAEYVPVVSATLTPGTLRSYRPYWKKTVEQWGGRRLDEGGGGGHWTYSDLYCATVRLRSFGYEVTVRM